MTVPTEPSNIIAPGALQHQLQAQGWHIAPRYPKLTVLRKLRAMLNHSYV